MKRKTILFGAALLAAAPATAHPEHDAPAPRPAAARDPVAAEKAAVQAVLSAYKSAIERLDAHRTKQLFTADSAIFETGGSEGTYANYLSHHLGPELREFKAFKFFDYKIEVHLLGPAAAHAIETYKYRIETKKGEIAERIGVATSVLRKENGRWKVAMMHNSGRRPRAK